MSATGVNMSLDEATKLSEVWCAKLFPSCRVVEATGTVRRKDQETTHDIDLVLIRDESKQEEFAKILDSLEYVKGKPDGKWCCRRLESGVMLDIRMCSEADWGWRLIQHTGPTDFYLWARAELDRIREKVDKRDSSGKWLTGGNTNRDYSTEEEVFKALGMEYVAPEDRHKIEVDMSTIQNKDVTLFGVIGQINFNEKDNTLENIIPQIENEDEVNLKINSPGGSAIEGLAIHDFFVNLDKPVSVDIFGEASSAAAIVSQSADKGKRRIAKNAGFFIHNPFIGLTGGEAKDLERDAKELRQFEDQMFKLFSNSTGLPQKKIRELMEDGGTRLDSKKALELGFVDEIIGAQNIKPIVWNMAEIPKEIAKQLPAIQKLKPNKSFRWQDADANTHQLPVGNELFDLRVNDRTFIITKETFLMVQEFVKESGFSTPDEALAEFKQLRKNKPQDPSNAGVLALESKNSTLQKNLDVTSSLLKGVIEKQDKEELLERRVRIDACLTAFRIDVSQKDKAIEAYVEIEPGDVKDSQPLFDASMIFMESSKPREDLKALVKLSGSGGEGENIEGSAQEQLVIYAKKKQDAKPEMTFKEAFNLAKEEHPELIEKLSEVN